MVVVVVRMHVYLIAYIFLYDVSLFVFVPCGKCQALLLLCVSLPDSFGLMASEPKHAVCKLEGVRITY